MTRTLLLILSAFCTLAAVSSFGTEITTRDGTAYHNAKVTAVDVDGIHVTHSQGVAKLRFEELPDALQKQYHYDPAKVAAYRKQVEDVKKAAAAQTAAAQPSNAQSTAASPTTAAHRPDELVANAESALRKNDLPRAAELLNAITSQYPNGTQARTVRYLASVLRERQSSQDGPITATEAQRLRLLMDALDNIKVSYRTATPEKQRALEAIFGRDTFEHADNGLDSLSKSSAKLRDARDKAVGQ